MTANTKLSLFEKAVPVAGVLFGLLALFTQGAPTWVRYLGMAIGVLLVAAWLISRASWLGKRITFRIFRSRLSKDQAVRLDVLMDETSNHVSYGYTLSPFYVWRQAANRHPDSIKMNYSYFHAIQRWVSDVRLQQGNSQMSTALLVKLLSSAICEATKLGEFAENELNEMLRDTSLPQDERSEIARNWESARIHFNQWIDKWQTLFKEINKKMDAHCIDYFRPLEGMS